jgi:hypothetical protein
MYAREKKKGKRLVTFGEMPSEGGPIRSSRNYWTVGYVGKRLAILFPHDDERQRQQSKPKNTHTNTKQLI